VEVYFQAFLTSAIDGGEWSTSRPGRYTPRERAPGTRRWEYNIITGLRDIGWDASGSR